MKSEKDIFLVDLDDTLLDFQSAERENLSFAFASARLPFDENIYSAFHVINDSLWKLLEQGKIDRISLRVKRFELLLQKFSLDADAERLSNAYFEHFPSVCIPFPGSREFLKELSQLGRVFVVTNGSPSIQREHLRLAGFSPFLSDVFLSEQIGADKPSQIFASFVAEHIPDFRKERAVWIGDSLSSDGACARKGGIDFILFCPHGKPADYQGMTARNYREALSLL